MTIHGSHCSEQVFRVRRRDPAAGCRPVRAGTVRRNDAASRPAGMHKWRVPLQTDRRFATSRVAAHCRKIRNRYAAPSSVPAGRTGTWQILLCGNRYTQGNRSEAPSAVRQPARHTGREGCRGAIGCNRERPPGRLPCDMSGQCEKGCRPLARVATVLDAKLEVEQLPGVRKIIAGTVGSAFMWGLMIGGGQRDGRRTSHVAKKLSFANGKHTGWLRTRKRPHRERPFYA